MPDDGRTTVCVVGGGPAGLVLGLLLARAGIHVTVLEKHADFLRDFRGDTVHASTLDLLDELGLGEAFAALPQRRLDRVEMELDSGTATLAQLSRLPGPHRYIALVPQWDLLELLARVAAAEPSFTLLRQAEVTGLLTRAGRVTGVRYRDRSDGTEHELGALLTVGCDGRDSTVRRSAGLRPRGFGVPMDVEWFRLPRVDRDPEGLVVRVSTGAMAVLIDRGDYWQCAYLIGKGGDDRLRAEPLEQFGRQLAALLPWLGDRVGALTGWDQVRLLPVRLDRLRRWYSGGLLLLGDAAHAMSPVGGVGINLAVQDAVAAARLLAGYLPKGSAARPEGPEAAEAPEAMGPGWARPCLPMLCRRERRQAWWLARRRREAARVWPSTDDNDVQTPRMAARSRQRYRETRPRLRRVQLRRWWPAFVVQTGQRLAHRVVIRRALLGGGSAGAGGGVGTGARTGAEGGTGTGTGAGTGALPLPLRMLERFPRLQALPARMIAIGPLPEHAPPWARRSRSPV